MRPVVEERFWRKSFQWCAPTLDCETFYDQHMAAMVLPSLGASGAVTELRWVSHGHAQVWRGAEACARDCGGHRGC